MGDALRHAATFQPFFLARPVLWVLLLLVLVGVPLCVMGALAAGLRESGEVVPSLGDAGAAPAHPRGPLDAPGARLRDVVAAPRARAAAVVARAAAWDRALPAWARLWPLALTTLVAWVLLARWGMQNHTFTID